MVADSSSYLVGGPLHESKLNNFFAEPGDDRWISKREGQEFLHYRLEGPYAPARRTNVLLYLIVDLSPAQRHIQHSVREDCAAGGVSGGELRTS